VHQVGDQTKEPTSVSSENVSIIPDEKWVASPERCWTGESFDSDW